MIKSMTGFGRGEAIAEFGHFTVEVRSVNSRSCNVVVKLPETLSSLDVYISNYIRSRISRGQISVSVDLNKDSAPLKKRVIVDQELAKEYYEQLTGIGRYLSLADPVSLSTIADLPGVLTVEEANVNLDKLWADISHALKIAVDQCIKMREAEGSAILADIFPRLETMSALVERISARTPQVIEEHRWRLQKRINDLMQGQVFIDESRIALEIAIVAERCDISEEIVRLQSHIRQMRDFLKDPKGPVGRRLDFTLQEINREVNTIASKANDFQISSDCIQLKDEIEKIREQVQNIE